MPRRSTPPKYARHASGQARARIDGRVTYLGEYGSPESREKYARLISEWLEQHDDPHSRSTLTVEQLALAYVEYAKNYYFKNGEATDHLYIVRSALRLLIRHHRGELVTEFSPRKLKRLQQVLIDDDKSRTYSNDLIGVIKRCFRWEPRRNW